MQKKLMDLLQTLPNKIISNLPKGTVPLIGNINVFVVVQTNDDIDVTTDTDVDIDVDLRKQLTFRLTSYPQIYQHTPQHLLLLF